MRGEKKERRAKKQPETRSHRNAFILSDKKSLESIELEE